MLTHIANDFLLVSLPELLSDFNLIKSKLKEFKAELGSHYANGYKSCPEDRFLEVMEPFIEAGEYAFSYAETAMVEMDTCYKDCVKFFGENPSIIKPDEFFGIFKTFMASFEVRFFVFYCHTHYKILYFQLMTFTHLY